MPNVVILPFEARRIHEGTCVHVKTDCVTIFDMVHFSGLMCITVREEITKIINVDFSGG